jgi:hypothetical protein
MTGLTALLGNRLAQLGRVVLGEAPAAPAATRPAWLPLLVVEFSPSTGPMGAAAWVDITDAVIGFSTDRGRSGALDKVEAGTLTLTLANDDRRFDALNSEGPYYGQLLPRKRIRVQAAWDGVLYPVFSGYVEEWSIPLWRHGAITCRVTASDAFALLAKKKISGTYSEQRAGSRVNAVLNDAGWSTGQAWVVGDAIYGVLGTTTIPGPVAARSISTGATTVQATTLSDVAALTHMQLMAQAENGRLFVGRAGEIVFKSRAATFYNLSERAKFGGPPAAGELPYRDLTINTSDDRVYNEVAATRPGGTRQAATDAASVNAYFGQTYSVTSLPLISDTEALAWANFVLSQVKGFAVRVDGLTFDPTAAPAESWPTALGLELGDRVGVAYRPDAGSALDESLVVERIAHTFTAPSSDWTTTLGLAPADVRSFWVLGDPVLSVLGSTTRPVY